MATTEFLLEGTSTLPNAEAIAAHFAESAQPDDEEEGVESISATSTTSAVKMEAVALVSSTSDGSTPTTDKKVHQKTNATTTKNSSAILGKALSSPVELSLTNPRGKFHVTFHAEGIHLTTIKNPMPLVIPAGSVRDIIVFPKPADCVLKSSKTPTTPSPMMLLCFQDNESHDCQVVTFKGKALSQLCFQVPTTVLDDAILDDESNNTNHSSTTETWIRLICRSVQLERTKYVYQIHIPNSSNKPTTTQWSFRSYQDQNYASTASGMPYVNCYHGVQDGSLFPMKEGLLFFK
jgi:hypothetical protein